MLQEDAEADRDRAGVDRPTEHLPSGLVAGLVESLQEGGLGLRLAKDVAAVFAAVQQMEHRPSASNRRMRAIPPHESRANQPVNPPRGMLRQRTGRLAFASHFHHKPQNLTRIGLPLANAERPTSNAEGESKRLT